MAPTKSIVTLGRRDLAAVTALVRPVKALYPDIDAWLTKVFDGIGSGSTALGVYSDSDLIGVALLRWKPAQGALKLATVYVSPGHRKSGVASLLFGSALEEFRESRLDRCYATLDSTMEPILRALLAKHGFRRVACLPERYASGRTELVYEFRSSFDF